MAKQGFDRDTGYRPGHAEYPIGKHTQFDARAFGGDKGHNSKPEKMHQGIHNEHPTAHDCNINGSRSHDPRPEAFHSNSNTAPGGHSLIRRGGSVYQGSRGTK
jgi:hypothetical protein